MITEQRVKEILGQLKDPYLKQTLETTEAFESISIKPEKNFVTVKIRLAQLDTPDQMKLQNQVVELLKESGVATVGIKFTQLPTEVIHKFAPEEEIYNEPTYIAIASGKGGVGKSTVSVNLAVALARQGKRVGLVDADIYGFSVPDMMGITEKPKVENEQLYPIERFGVKVMSMGFFVEDNKPIIWRGPMLGKMLKNFLTDVVWGELDYLLLDLPPGTGDVALDVHQMLPTSKEIIVTTPHATASFVAARAGTMAINTNHEVIGVVENMSYFESKLTGEREFIFGKGGGEKLSKELNVDLLGQLPLGQPDNNENDSAPSVYGADHRTGQLFDEIAKKLMEKLEK
ncbi:MAG: chromosome partitioning protein ParA [Bacillales bacterium]|jgi:ATP-binding protein involved in chromosome partitioning|nr:chromosome partitioning protein ParA [Bacillales bacterium]